MRQKNYLFLLELHIFHTISIFLLNVQYLFSHITAGKLFLAEDIVKFHLKMSLRPLLIAGYLLYFT